MELQQAVSAFSKIIYGDLWKYVYILANHELKNTTPR